MYSLDLLIELNICEIAQKLVSLFNDSKSDLVFEHYYVKINYFFHFVTIFLCFFFFKLKKGKIKDKEGKFESALRDFDESLIIDPMFNKSMVAKANILVRVPAFKDLSKAQEILLKAIRFEETPETMLLYINIIYIRKNCQLNNF